MKPGQFSSPAHAGCARGGVGSRSGSRAAAGDGGSGGSGGSSSAGAEWRQLLERGAVVLPLKCCLSSVLFYLHRPSYILPAQTCRLHTLHAQQHSTVVDPPACLRHWHPPGRKQALQAPRTTLKHYHYNPAAHKWAAFSARGRQRQSMQGGGRRLDRIGEWAWKRMGRGASCGAAGWPCRGAAEGRGCDC